MQNPLSKEYRFASLVRFALPTTVMMMFMSFYTIVDGIFVSRFVGTDALSAINLTYPFSSVLLAIAIMFSTGGNAVVSFRLGQGDHEGARRGLTLIAVSAVICCTTLAAAGLIWMDPLVRMLGATDALVPYCKEYLSVLLLAAPFSSLQILFQAFFVTAGRPNLGLFVTVLAGITNAVLDYVFIVPLGMGIRGAAVATAIGYMIPAICGVLFFCKRGKRALFFVRPTLDWRMLRQSCLNGSSEMVSNLSNSVITFLFNLSMMRLAGPTGVAAISIVLYGQFLMVSLYMGFSMGVAPIVGYNYGSDNRVQLRRVYRYSLAFILGASVAVCAVSLLGARGITAIFSPPGTDVYAMTVRGMVLFAGSYLFAGVNIYSSALFTALSDGKTSALISFARTFGLILPGLLLLPPTMGVDGVWLAVPLAELATLLLSVLCLFRGGVRCGFMSARSAPHAAG